MGVNDHTLTVQTYVNRPLYVPYGFSVYGFSLIIRVRQVKSSFFKNLLKTSFSFCRCPMASETSYKKIETFGQSFDPFLALFWQAVKKSIKKIGNFQMIKWRLKRKYSDNLFESLTAYLWPFCSSQKHFF